MSFPGNNQSYATAVGTATVRAPIFMPRDPGVYDLADKVIGQSWVNTRTDAIWILQTISTAGDALAVPPIPRGTVTAQWRSIGPVAVFDSNPITGSQGVDYAFPLGQIWVNKTNNTAWILTHLTTPTPPALPTPTWISVGGGIVQVGTLKGNTGAAVPPTGGNINVVGDGTSVTVAGNPGTSTLTISLVGGGGPAFEQFLPDSGTSPVVPNGTGQVTMAGSGSIQTVGSLNTLTTELTGLTNHNVLVGAGTTTITKVDPTASAAGVPLVAQGGAADPVFGTALVAGGGTGLVTAGTHLFAPVCTGTTATGNFQIADTGISNVNYVLTSTGAASLPTWQSVLAIAGFTRINVQVFPPGVSPYVPYNAGGQTMKYCIVECVGGGGGGGGTTTTVSAGGGGGSGAYARSILSAATIGVSQVVTIGTGGTGGIASGNGGNGGTTSLGALVVAGGGSGGTFASGTAVNGNFYGAGGTATAGDILVSGNDGGNVFLVAAGAQGGAGAPGPFGGGRGNTVATGAAANTAQAGGSGLGYGAGGAGGAASGAASPATGGGAGADGVVIITEFIS